MCFGLSFSRLSNRNYVDDPGAAADRGEARGVLNQIAEQMASNAAVARAKYRWTGRAILFLALATTAAVVFLAWAATVGVMPSGA